MADDFVYEAAPLVEVIAEIHWHIERLATVPEGGIDPHFSALIKQLSQALPTAGFTHVEHLVPAFVPLELLAEKPIYRYWTSEGTYPLVQVGPGLLTVNIVPPYEGWRAFKPIIKRALEVLRSSYPLADNLLKIERLDLRYLDGFTRKHGMATYARFIRDNLSVGISLPREILGCIVAPGEDNVTCIADLSFPLADKPNTSGTIRLRPGIVGGEQGAIMECAVRWSDAEKGIAHQNIEAWFDDAHECVRSWFFALVKDRLVESFGRKRSVAG